MVEKEWYTYRIFISSTFKDMDQERDAIKFHVINRLNEHYRDRKIQFQVVDLRIGINTEKLTEEESENLILDTCLQCIDSARPFFIGLLGERYGWIPPVERWKSVVDRLGEEKRQLLIDGENKSVTELEILYGAIGDKGKYINHCLFFFRDIKSYTSIPDEYRSFYFDQENVDMKSSKNKELKDTISDILVKNKRKNLCEPYSLTWNSTDNQFEGLNQFADLVFKRLCDEIDEEIKDRIPPQSVMEQELLNKEYLHMNNVLYRVEATQYDEILRNVIDGQQIVLTGPEGSGKSVMFSQVFKFLSQDDGICLSSFVGMSPYSKTMDSIARGWIFELCGEEIDKDKDEKFVIEKLLSCIEEAREEGKRVFLLLDGIENFAPLSPKDVFLAWLPDHIPFLATASESCSEKLLRHHPHFSTKVIQPMNDTEEVEIIKLLGKYFNCNLSERLHSWICKNTSRPVCINLLMIIIAYLGANDYKKIRNQNVGSEIDKINRFIDDTLSRAPLNEVSQMLKFSITKVAETLEYGEEFLNILQYIAHSAGGLNETDLSLLLGEKWDSLRFHSLMGIFRDHFYCEIDQRRWHFRNMNCAKAFLLKNTIEGQRLHTNIAQLLLTYDDYEKQKQDLLFYQLLKSGRADLARGLMTDIGSEKLLPQAEWYKISMYYILAEENVRDTVRNLCRSFSPSERAGFVYYFYRFLTSSSHTDLLMQIVDDNLYDVCFDELGVVNAYRMANLYCYLKHSSGTLEFQGIEVDHQRMVYYLERSIEGFRYCYSMNPDYEDTKNMLVTTMSLMLPEFAKKNDLISIEKYIKIINSLNNLRL